MMGGVTAILFFAFGIAAGILIAFAGAGFLQDSAGLVVTVFLVALLVVLGLGVLLFAARRPIWRRLFGVAEATLESLAGPLARVAERAIERDPTGATQAARDLVTLVLARYSWVSARRWLIASLTGLIAAMAALAGTALLFKQNQLIGEQSALLRQQNEKIDQQTGLLAQQVELAEAERNSALSVEITAIAAALGEAAVRAEAGGGPGAGAPAGAGSNFVNALDVQQDIDRGLILRITSLSRALKPYRFLDTGRRPGDPSDTLRLAMQGRRADLPETYARMQAYYGWADPDTATRLIDRPASPERGQLLNVLVTGGLRNLEPLTAAGLDLTHAWLPEIGLGAFTAQGARLSMADFSGAQLAGFDLGGCFCENARFRRARIDDGDFSVLPAERLKWPFRPEDAPFSTVLSGSDFSDAVVVRGRFGGAWMIATDFDGAILRGADFSKAELGTSTFRGAVLLAADFTGAGLKSVDFEGAVVFGADALDRLGAAAAEGTFHPADWALQPLAIEDLLDRPVVANAVGAEDLAAAMVAGEPFLIHRTGKPLD